MNIFNLPIWIVLDEVGNILLLKRIDRGTWEPVKWAINKWETPEDTIKREFFEETWMDKDMIISFENYGVFSDTIKLETWIFVVNRYVFVFRIDAIKPQISINYVVEWGKDHEEYWWYTINEIKSLDIEYKEFFIEILYMI